MIKPEMVPDNVEKHFRWCAANTFMTTRECLAAALNAWPEAKRVKGYFTHDADYYEPAFILPLEAPQGRISAQEGGDE